MSQAAARLPGSETLKNIAAIARWWLVCAMQIGVVAAHAGEAARTDYRHLGAASCASSACHGKVAAQIAGAGGVKSNVALNEYRRWLTEDRHSQAYLVLDSQQSKQIAAKLGIVNPMAAPICLNCHADNVPAAQRGPKFQIRDGVSCEACHGGAEKWIDSHAGATATHQANLALGMYRTELPRANAELCLSCHLGTRDRFATHAIMGAGHPRLSFELETFVALQPAHHVVDQDYIARKGSPNGTALWIAGQIESARRTLQLLQSPVGRGTGMFPELALYDCHSCHHPMSNLRWTRQRAGEGIQPGTLRLQTQHLLMLQAVAEIVEPAAVPELAAARQGLIRAGQTDVTSVMTASTRLLDWLKARDAWSQRKFSADETGRIRRAVLGLAVADRSFDYLAAEQVVFGVQTLTYALNDMKLRKGALDLLFDAVKSETAFDAARFSAAARAAQPRF
jgi:hypothetical protein